MIDNIFGTCNRKRTTYRRGIHIPVVIDTISRNSANIHVCVSDTISHIKIEFLPRIDIYI